MAIRISENKTMFWEFALKFGYIAPSTHQDCIQETLPLKKKSDVELPKFESFQDHSIPFIDLNANDLMKAGYQNNKKAWTEDEDRILKREYEENRK